MRCEPQTLEEAGEAAGEVLSEIGDALDGLAVPSEESLEGGGVEGATTAAVPAETAEKKAAVGVSSLEMAKDLVVDNKEVLRTSAQSTTTCLVLLFLFDDQRFAIEGWLR